ncbi:brassinosteroid LRR receptor kinase BRI1-like [Triticum dicoccoides]|uniref:brassinosteroid LRR receptor kinase BRI1-like n=1 Tax=Triticum dicoccoides TaxID=85692 RepID=UPI00189024A3|nr:brassinosteroid LRR receptor kinase BRI1-like [Triticum dicoccoides]
MKAAGLVKEALVRHHVITSKGDGGMNHEASEAVREETGLGDHEHEAAMSGAQLDGGRREVTSHVPVAAEGPVEGEADHETARLDRLVVEELGPPDPPLGVTPLAVTTALSLSSPMRTAQLCLAAAARWRRAVMGAPRCQNKRECEYLAVRLSIIGDVLPRLPRDADVDRPLRELGKTLGEAHELVLACQNWSTARQLIGARRHADSLKEVSTRIDSYINLLNLVFNTTAGRSPRHHTTTAPSPGSSSCAAGPVRLTWADIAAATNYFAVKLVRGSSEALYKGRLRDGPEVAVKVLNKNGRRDVDGALVAEVEILFPIRHQHIVRLVAWCSEEEDRMCVYEHEQMSNGTLRDHLMRLRRRARVRARLQGSSSSSSPVRATWKARVEVLVGASQAIEHLHGRAVIHRNVSSFNILLDGSWSPRLSSFGEAILQEATGDQLVAEVVGTPGYLDPEYRRTSEGDRSPNFCHSSEGDRSPNFCQP